MVFKLFFLLPAMWRALSSTPIHDIQRRDTVPRILSHSAHTEWGFIPSLKLKSFKNIFTASDNSHRLLHFTFPKDGEHYCIDCLYETLWSFYKRQEKMLVFDMSAWRGCSNKRKKGYSNFTTVSQPRNGSTLIKGNRTINREKTAISLAIKKIVNVNPWCGAKKTTSLSE